MEFLYHLSIFLYGIAIRVAAVYSAKARLWVQGRKGLMNRLELALANHREELIWMHCASVGEFEQGRPLLEQIRRQHPHYKLLLTFFSPSGYELRKNYSGADFVYYLPLDTAQNARRFMDIVKPSLVVFVKYDYWLNYLTECRKRNIPHILISAIFRPSQIFFIYLCRMKKACIC
jgi:3-deoxy-D-manno-octulosonic-acid transferase